MTRLRIHYALSLGGFLSRCGLLSPKNWTVEPKKVTCGNCKRLLGKEMK